MVGAVVRWRPRVPARALAVARGATSSAGERRRRVVGARGVERRSVGGCNLVDFECNVNENIRVASPASKALLPLKKPAIHGDHPPTSNRQLDSDLDRSPSPVGLKKVQTMQLAQLVLACALATSSAAESTSSTSDLSLIHI